MYVYAVDISDPTLNPVAKFGTIGTLVNLIVPVLMTGAALVFLIMLMRAGFMIITAGGSSEQVAKAQKMMTFAVIGLIFIISSFTLVKLIGFVFQISDKLPF